MNMQANPPRFEAFSTSHMSFAQQRYFADDSRLLNLWTRTLRMATGDRSSDISAAHASRSLYSPLDPAQQEIRIVSLLPGQPWEPVRCHLLHVSLQAYKWTRYVLENYYLTEHDALYAPPYATEAEYAEADRRFGLGVRKCSSKIMAFRREPQRSFISQSLPSESFLDQSLPFEEDFWQDRDYCETELDIPGCDYDPCQCFEALSYAWGPFTEQRSILVNDKYQVSVSDNCHAALLRIRRPEKNRRLWIDAICIHQANLEERATQVRMMGELYSRAPGVLVWLGDVDIELAWKSAVKRYPQMFHWLVSPGGDNTNWLMAPIKEKEVESQSQSGYSLRVKIERETTARWTMLSLAIGEIETHTKSSWFLRSWIVQEVVNARYAPVVQLGSFEATWLDLVHAFQPPPWKNEIAQAMRLLDSNRSGNQQDRSIIDFIDSVRQRDCTDPRDKVYSLLGMVRSLESSKVEVDYSECKTSAMVYAQATFASMLGDKSLRALAAINPEEHQTPNLPTWAVDFLSKTDFDLDTLGNPRVWTSDRPNVEASVSLVGDVLVAQGLLFDGSSTWCNSMRMKVDLMTTGVASF